MQTALIIIHVIIALVLTVIVLMQHGKQQGLSGAIAGGAETFFGKNKGRTVDAMLKKVTAVFAVLFINSSIVLTVVSINKYSSENAAVDTGDSSTMNVTMDEAGNLVDENGNIVMTAEDMAAQQEQAAAEDGTVTEDGAVEGTVEDAAGAVEDAAEDTAEAAEGAVEGAAEAAEGATEDTAEAVEGAADDAAAAAENAAE